MREGGNRRQRDVEFVADDADDFLPRLHFLTRQFAREALDLQQAMRATVQTNVALRQVKRLVFVVEIDGEQSVLMRSECGRQRLRALGDDFAEIQTIHALAAVEQSACGGM